jgi:hypothetical protein
MRSEDRGQHHHESVLTILADIAVRSVQDIPRNGGDSQTFGACRLEIRQAIFKFPANAAVPGVNSRFGSIALRASSRIASPVGTGILVPVQEIFSLGPRIHPTGRGRRLLRWSYGIDLQRPPPASARG